MIVENLKSIAIILFVSFLSCKENEIAKINTVGTVESKDSIVEASATPENECLLKSTLALPYS
ncbi:hypothetical protein SAMN05444363_2074 [Flavobacterium terrae]|uniref:Uncharacterized protein n=1 Tax=Flavobacterium terrae TaxID=415425 RepID=A0A1M6F0P9_9FLAO|nr:hypothetical protein SAMN05444363_2074 [Flavobacterium terrae]